jgi:hypothetical protein
MSRTLRDVEMASGWHEGELAVQRRAGVTDHVRLRTGVLDRLPPHFVAFLAVQRFVVTATVDGKGDLWCSMAPGWPGFATVPAPDTVAIVRRAFGADVLAHLERDSRIGLIALDPSTRRRIRVNGRATLEEDVVLIHVAETFGNCRQYVQQRPAEGPEPTSAGVVAEGQTLDGSQRDWIRRADTCFIASMHPAAGPDASHRGGRPGFVQVDDDRTLRFPDYDGNGMFQTLGNLTANPAAAMLFIDFENGGMLQLTGAAEVHWDEREAPAGRTVQFALRSVVEKRPSKPWRWPVVEYSPVNP